MSEPVDMDMNLKDKLSAHAPLPWRYDKDNCNVYANGLLAKVYGHNHTGERFANAAHIVKCVNLHDELVDALDKAYLQIIVFLNEGHFGRKIEFDSGYIVDALAKARSTP